ncbi:MAG: hypothetical protein JSW17_06410 [Candidatus Omnitrophota bacterium]|nr:MAG: hypothetical protein JSW17_06410 [Candidatus Omnitrophota bacterium]
MQIDSYSFGSITVDGKVYTDDLIVFPEKVSSGWWRKQGHSLCMEDLAEVLVYKPQILIVGKGASSCMDIPSSTVQILKDEGIEVIGDNTASAVELFNEYIGAGKKVVGAFHLTC